MRKILVYITKVYVLIFITGVFSESTVRGLEFYSDSHLSFKDTSFFYNDSHPFFKDLLKIDLIYLLKPDISNVF